MPRYTEEQLTLALKRSRGEVTEAARLLGCSHTSIDKRLAAKTAEGKRLRELRAGLKRRLVGASTTNITRAIDDRCWECGGSKVAALEPKLLGDPIEGPCEVCGGTGYHGGKREAIEPSERRHYSFKVLERLGREQGWGERIEVVKIPANWLDDLSEEQLAIAEAQLHAGIPLREVYRSLTGQAPADPG